MGSLTKVALNGVFVNIKSDNFATSRIYHNARRNIKKKKQKLDVDNLDFELIRFVKKIKR